MSSDSTSSRGRWKRYAAGGALVAAGLTAGGALAGGLVANADTVSGTPAAAAAGAAAPTSGATDPTTSVAAPDTTDPAGGSADGSGNRDESQPQRSDETLLTGTTAAKVTALAKAKYPGATIQRVETDSDGVYEAHLVTADGQRVIVQVGADFTVTGVQTH